MEIKRNSIKIFLLLTLIMSLIGNIFLAIVFKSEKEKLVEVRYVIIEHQKTDWDIFIGALICTESGGNDTIVGQYDSANSVGCLQITPWYVNAVNEILNEEKYTLDDRLSREKSIEMFNIMQDYHNPKHDLNTAIKLHNPNASVYYYDKIINKYIEFKNKK